MKKMSILVLLLLLGTIASAMEPGKVIYAMVQWENGEYQILDTKIVIDYQMKTDSNGNYLVKLIDSSNKTLYQIKTRKPINTMPAPPGTSIEEKKEWYNKKPLSGSMQLFLPYLKKAKTLSFEHGTKVLARTDLSKLCNENGECEEPENYLSCPEDCSLDKKDRYCLAEQDGTCDPDCMKGIDPDCKEEKPKPEELDWVGVGIISGIILILLFILISKKRK